MKIVIATQSAPIYLPYVLDEFAHLLKMTNHTIDGILIFSSLNKNGFLHEIKTRLNYYGPKAFLKYTIYILKNKFLSYLFNLIPAIKPHSAANVIKKYNLRQIKTVSINDDSFINYIKVNQIDLIISIACPKIFKKEILQASRLGCINYHTALLPKNRGRQPLFWALLNNEKETGITIHKINRNIDDGSIIVQQKIKIDPQDSLHNLYLKTTKLAPALLITALNKIAQDENYLPNDAPKATHHSFPTASDSKLFRQKGKKFF